MIGIYKITNTINGKVYIGQAQDIERRWREHRQDYLKENNVVYRAMRKYGIENFSFEVIEECSIEELNILEIKYVEQYNSYVNLENSNGYNMTLGGDGTRGFVPSQETREKRSRSLKGRVFSKKHRAKIGESNRNRQYSEETKKKIGEYHKKENLTEDALERLRNKAKERIMREGNPMQGRNHTIEARLKIGESKKKKVICENKIFNSVKECAEYYNISYSTMKAWLGGRNKMRQDFVDKGLKYV